MPQQVDALPVEIQEQNVDVPPLNPPTEEVLPVVAKRAQGTDDVPPLIDHIDEYSDSEDEDETKEEQEPVASRTRQRTGTSILRPSKYSWLRKLINGRQLI